MKRKISTYVRDKKNVDFEAMLDAPLKSDDVNQIENIMLQKALQSITQDAG